MNFKRIGRTLVCLLLVCCLLVTCPPVQAYAMSPGVAAAIIIGVPAAFVIASSLIGQGILPGPGEVFNNLVNDIKMSVAVQRFIYDDKIDVLASTNTATDETQYYVSQEVLEAVQEAAFETGAISVSVPDIPVLRAGNAIISNGRHYSAPVDTYVFAIYPSAGYSACYLYLVSTEPFSTWVESWYNGTMDFEKKASSFVYNEVTYYYASASVSSTDYLSSIGIVASGSTTEYIGKVLSGELSYGETQITLADGLVKGAVVGSNAISLPEAYPDWADKSIEQEDHDIPIPYFPIGLGNTYEETISKSQEDVWNGVSEYTAAVLDNWTSLLGAISAIKTFVGSIATSIGSWFENVISEIGAFAASVSTWFENVISKIEAIPDAFSQWFDQIIDYGASVLDKLGSLAVAIADAVVEAFCSAFTLDEAYVRSEFDSLLSEFKFLDSMVNFGRNVVDVFYGIGTKPPILYIDLDAAESSVDYGDRVVFLDLTWYERYKPYGDAIISSFLWAFFGWRLLHHLPGLINGSSGIVPHFK